MKKVKQINIRKNGIGFNSPTLRRFGIQFGQNLVDFIDARLYETLSNDLKYILKLEIFEK